MPEWLSYETYDKNAEAKVLVDFDAELNDPQLKSRFPECASLTVAGFDSDADGAPSDAAATDLYDLQTAIEQALGDQGVVAACVASAGNYRYVAYAATQPAGLTLQPLAPASWSSDEAWANDPSWNAYDALALEGDDLEAARDRMQLDDLKNRLPDLPDSVTFTFDLDFDSAESARNAHAAFVQAGYIPSPAEIEGDPDLTYEFDRVVRAAWTGKPDLDALVAARREIGTIAAQFGGKYLGWGTEADLEVTP